MSLRAVSSTQNSITLEWKGLDDAENTQYILKMKDAFREWITVYSGYKTQNVVKDLYSGEAYQFQLTSQTDDGQVLSCSPETAFATKGVCLFFWSRTEEHQSLAHLHRAIKSGNVTKAQKYLKTKGQAVDAFDHWGRPALMVSAWHGNSELVGLMLANGADVNLPSCELGQTTLMVACLRGDADIVQQLSDRGALWDTKDKNGCTALTYAVDASQIVCLELALAAGADIETRDKQGWTPLMRAVMLESTLHVIETLINHGANVLACDDRKVTCLMLAALSGRVGVVKVLLARGADATVKDVYGNTAREMATTKQCQEIMDLLKVVSIKKETIKRLIGFSRDVSAATSQRQATTSVSPLVLTELTSGSPKSQLHPSPTHPSQ